MSEPIHAMRVRVTTPVPGATLVLNVLAPDLYTPEKDAAKENLYGVQFLQFKELHHAHEGVVFQAINSPNAAFMLAQDPNTMAVSVRAAVWSRFPGARLKMQDGSTIETDDHRAVMEFQIGGRHVSIDYAYEPLPSADAQAAAWSELGPIEGLTLDHLERVIPKLTLEQVAKLAAMPTLPTALFEPLYAIGASAILQSFAINPATPSAWLAELSTFFPALVLFNPGLDLALLMDPNLKLHYQTRIAYEARGRQEGQRR